MLSFKSVVPFPRASAALATSDPFTMLQRDLSRMLADVWRDYGTEFPADTGAAAMMPRLDVKETAKDLRILAELPGVAEKDVEVELNGALLSIRGEKKIEKDEDEKGYHLRERSYGSYQRSLTLPFEVKAEELDARFENGVLTVVVPKPSAALASTRKVPVRAA